jgi:superfamily II DNA or RNA helicase
VIKWNPIQFEKLSERQQQILQVLAIGRTPLSLSTLIELLNACDWAAAATKSGVLTQALLKVELKPLGDLGFISRSGSAMSYSEAEESVLDPVVQQSVLNRNFEKIVAAIEENKKRLDVDAGHLRNDRARLVAHRLGRIAFYRGDIAAFDIARATLANEPLNKSHLGVLEPFNEQIFRDTPVELQAHVLVNSASLAMLTGGGSIDALAAYDQYMEQEKVIPDSVGAWWAHLLAARGDTKKLEQVARSKQAWSHLAEAYLEFLKGKHEKCDVAFDAILSLWRKDHDTKARSFVLPFPLGIFQLLLLLQKNDPDSRTKLAAACASAEALWPENLRRIATAINAAVAYSENPSSESKESLKELITRTLRTALPIVQAIVVHLMHWYLPDEPIKESAGKSLLSAVNTYQSLGLNWFAALCEDAAVLSKETVNNELVAGQRHKQLATFPMLDWVEPLALWKRKLESLRKMVEGKKPTPKTASSPQTGFDERMIWELNVSGNRKYADLRPMIQKFSGNSWTKGRPVALERLYQNQKKPEFSFLTEQDRAVCRTITTSEVPTGYYRYTETVYDFDSDQALEALVGHPFIFVPEDRAQPLELTMRPPQLVIRKVNKGFRLELNPKPSRDQSLVVNKESDQRIALVRFTPQQLRIASILDGAIDCPGNSQADVLATAKALSTLLSVQSDIEMEADANDTNVKIVAADSRPHLHLSPFHAGLRAEFFVQPFGDTGPSFAVGQGGKNVLAVLGNESWSTRRDFRHEFNLARDIVAACPSLATLADTELSPCEFPVAESALEMLMEIEPLRELGSLVVHWPQGESLRVVGQVGSSQLQIRIKRDRDWFAASGEVVVDELIKMDLLRLIDLVSASPSRFVALDDGRFLALTEQLRHRLGELAAYGERKSDSLRFPQIRATALSDLDEWCTLKSDNHWKSCLKRIDDARDIVAAVPSTLNAELRDYQIEGYRWLCRLSHWGVGACLADDMGLGKTLQAIALLLQRGADGPALVIAPTSVCFNWETELHRFAPTLNPRLLGGGDRTAFFADLGPRDVAIISYGLLNTEIERLQAIEWRTIILDEAQAIKNTLTKRSQAAMSLTSDFRLILTGTPIENHLGELWNLFQFINPGLLGSLEQFHQRFALPIERDHNREVSQQLKRLVQPFLLRRTKSQVLSELPPRIEVTVPVTLSDEEAALYETARQRAVAQLTDDTKAQGRHVRILAEIMRLRRACCHPSLLLPECGLPGAKLAAFSETIDELMENKHKALVFSQFVDHLSILRAELDRKGIVYQYLDGSTPVRERKRSVEAFQNGEGDVFLISLKAGGTGLNLTAADYVLHMDPWWNPAVEDQAADRAHRLGQLRPVTIYRFITRGTIEEKILDLHSTKRELADNLLEGSEMTGRLSGEELLELIR